MNGGKEDSGLFWDPLPVPLIVNCSFPLSSPLHTPAVHWVATLNVGSGGAHASYYHKANEQVRLLGLSPSLVNQRESSAPRVSPGFWPIILGISSSGLHFHACVPACLYPVRTPAVSMVMDPPLILVPASQVQVGVEFEANTRLQDTTFSFGYHLTLPQADMVFRGEGF